MPLEEYKQKRRFARTPEPAGELIENSGHLFVVQKHSSSHLHYDFRLEIGGVLKSWAIPKGPSLNPDDKRLAVQVEDHPVDYVDFEGTIPEGEYGAGRVIVWDRGEFFVEGEPQEALYKGHLRFALHGHKLTGSFDLVSMKSKGGNMWLLIKSRDEFADSSRRITDESLSVKSGLILEELTENNRNEHKEAPAKKVFRPMLPTLIQEPFSDPAWIYEIKWDGVRSICFFEDGKLRLISRNLKDLSSKYPEVTASSHQINAKSAVLDGEIIALDEKGKPNFQKLQKRIGLTLIVFDLLSLNGKDIISQPLLIRKKMLADIVSGEGKIVVSDFIREEGELFFENARAKGLEGIVAKRAESKYKEGRSRDWLKIKVTMSQDCVIAGYTEPRGSRKRFGALLLGVYEKGELYYIGRVGGGFDEKLIEKLFKLLAPLEIPDCPFGKPPKPNAGAHWIYPKLVCEVKFAEWTDDGHLRQPIFLGLRFDKEPEECVREVPTRSAFVGKKLRPSESIEMEIDGRALKITNPNKLFWRREDLRKIELIEYYSAVADFLTPHLADRPIVMKRYPDGIEGDFFFQKDAADYTPDWVKTVHLFSESTGEFIDYILCNDKTTLVYLANLACIDQNHWLSRVGSLENPDYVLFDIDPAPPAGFRESTIVAHLIKDLMYKLGLRSFVKTSGATGIHVLVPVEKIYTYKQIRDFAHLTSLLLQRKNEKLITLERDTAKRTGKVYIDFEQIVQGKSIASVYSVRPFPGAPVSAPLLWNELNEDTAPEEFNMRNLPGRLNEKGDIFKQVLTLKQNLSKPIERLEKLVVERLGAEIT